MDMNRQLLSFYSVYKTLPVRRKLCVKVHRLTGFSVMNTCCICLPKTPQELSVYHSERSSYVYPVCTHFGGVLQSNDIRFFNAHERVCVL